MLEKNRNFLRECSYYMHGVGFAAFADYLRQGREIKFVYKGRGYSITNHAGLWHLCDDTSHTLLETLCPFDEKELLVEKIAVAVLDDLTIREIFDRGVYDREKLCIL